MIRVPPLPPEPTKGAAAVVPARQWPPFVWDSSEQTPWLLPGATRMNLMTGDYSCCAEHAPIGDAPGQVVIERKNKNDFWKVVGSDHVRFKAELHRLKVIPYRLIVIESHAGTVLTPPEQQTKGEKHGRKVHPNQVRGSIFSWTARYCPVVFWNNHALAAHWAALWLMWAHEQAIEDTHNRALRAAEKPDAGQQGE